MSDTIAYASLCGQGCIPSYDPQEMTIYDEASKLFLIPRHERLEIYALPKGHVKFI